MHAHADVPNISGASAPFCLNILNVLSFMGKRIYRAQNTFWFLCLKRWQKHFSFRQIPSKLRPRRAHNRECSLSCSQQLATCTCLAPDEPSSRHPVLLFRIHFNIIHPRTPRSSKRSFTFMFRNQNWVSLSLLPSFISFSSAGHEL